MAERATIFENVQIGVESTPGTAVAANKKLQSLSIAPAVQVDMNRHRSIGNKFPSIITPGKEWVSARVDGVGSYTELVYPFASVLAYAAPVQQASTAAYLWTFAPNVSSPDTYKTYTVEAGSSVRAHKFAHGAFESFGMEFTRALAKADGTMLGAALSDNISMTGSPSLLTNVPILPTQVDVYLADTYAGLSGASALSRALMASWRIGSRYRPVFPLLSGTTSFAALVEGEPALACALKIEADAEGMGLLTTMRSGATKFLRIEAVGANIEDTYDYRLTIDTAVKVDNVSEFSDEDGVFAIEWSFSGVYDATWGKATQVELMTTVTAL